MASSSRFSQEAYEGGEQIVEGLLVCLLAAAEAAFVNAVVDVVVNRIVDRVDLRPQRRRIEVERGVDPVDAVESAMVRASYARGIFACDGRSCWTVSRCLV